jgi:hypothetical protein
MRKLIIEQTANSPKVILDPELNLFEISGESRPPDVAAFYLEIMEWFDDFSEYLDKSRGISHPVIINFDFGYFNTSSAKYILDLCKLIGAIQVIGKKIEIKWHYDENDRDMLEAGQQMSRIAKLPFEFIKRE